MSEYRFNWWRFLLGQGFWLMETSYFGWNGLPGSDAELICDGIVLLISALSIERVKP